MFGFCSYHLLGLFDRPSFRYPSTFTLRTVLIDSLNRVYGNESKKGHLVVVFLKDVWKWLNK